MSPRDELYIDASQVWQFRPSCTVLGKLRQGDHCEFEASLCYIEAVVVSLTF